MIDLTPILQALIGLLATLIAARLIPWIKARTTAQQQAMLGAAVDVLVYAAEQLYGAGNGEAKFQYVADRLREKGLSMDVDTIEAAVRRMAGK